MCCRYLHGTKDHFIYKVAKDAGLLGPVHTKGMFSSPSRCCKHLGNCHRLPSIYLNRLAIGVCVCQMAGRLYVHRISTMS